MEFVLSLCCKAIYLWMKRFSFDVTVIVCSSKSLENLSFINLIETDWNLLNAKLQFNFNKRKQTDKQKNVFIYIQISLSLQMPNVYRVLPQTISWFRLLYNFLQKYRMTFALDANYRMSFPLFVKFSLQIVAIFRKWKIRNVA